MSSHSSFRNAKWRPVGGEPWALVLTTGALLAGVAIGAVVPLVGLGQMRLVLAGVIALIGAGVLLVRPGIAMAMYLFVGMFKADPLIGKLIPFDLTAGLATLLVLACVIRLLRSDHLPLLPRPYLLYLPIVLSILASLLYTPIMSVGADKAGRFLLLTGLAILCPFILLDTPRRTREFLYSMGAVALVLSAESLMNLGGSDRLVAPGTSTIQLGVAAGTGIAIAWSLVLPRLSFGRRVLLYPAVGAMFIALLGAGARGPLIGAVCCVLFALWHFRKLRVDAAILAVAGVCGLARVGIPAASLDYLATLVSDDPSAALATRNGLMALAWRLFQEHPILGIGIGGYQYYSRDPENIFPHNIFLEIGSELGIVAVVAFTGLVVWAFWEAVQQLKDREFPFWRESFAVLSLLIFGFLQMIKSGDINDNRTMWFSIGLPFLLRNLRFESHHATSGK